VAGTGSLHQRGAVALHTAVLNIGPHCQQHLKQLNRVIRKSSFTTMKAISSRRIRAKNNMLKLICLLKQILFPSKLYIFNLFDIKWQTWIFFFLQMEKTLCVSICN
jgi:hypothetical protein